MEGFGLPMSFGKKTKDVSVNMKAKLEQSKRAEEVSNENGCVQLTSRSLPNQSRQ
jgi:hypothetical protein